MEGIKGSGSMNVKTEWSANPTANAEPRQAPKPQQNVGERLNKMTGVTTTADPYAQTTKKKLDKDAFLKMFMTQLKYQDPTSPVDNEKMAQQMAMFSQIEQSVTTNQYLEKMLARQDDRSQLAFSMIGKHVAADKASIFHDKLQQTQFNFELPKEASSLSVDILDEAGEIVKTIDMDSHAEGSVGVRWDGTTADGQPAMSGRYFYNVNATDKSGQPIVIDKKVEGLVEGITRSGGDTFLLVDGQKINLNEVSTVKQAAAEESKDDPNVSGMSGTKSEGNKVVSQNDGQSANAAKVEPNVQISEEVAKALREEEPIEDNRLNPMMPIFMR